MKKMPINKKKILLILIITIAILVCVLVLFNHRIPGESFLDSSGSTDTVNNEISENGNDMETPRDVEGHSYWDFPEDWQEETETELRQLVESEGYITAEIIGEIDSNKISDGTGAETTISISRGGYDIVIKGAFIRGCTGITVFNKSGKIVASSDTFLTDDEFRIINAPVDNYHIVVNRFREDIAINCLLKIYLEMTKPEIELPYLIAKSKVSVTNPYGAEMIFESSGNSITIAPKSSSTVNLTEGENAIKYYLKDGDNHSATINAVIVVDTTPPVITLVNTYEKSDYMVFNMYVNEYVEYIRINGIERQLLGGSDSDGTYPFAHTAELGTKSITVEACDPAGNVTKTVLSN